jgi:hypothetical protein
MLLPRRQVLFRCTRKLCEPASASDPQLRRDEADTSDMPDTPAARQPPEKRRSSPAPVSGDATDRMAGSRCEWSALHRRVPHQSCDRVRAPRSSEYPTNLCFLPACLEDTLKTKCQPSDSCFQNQREWPPVRGHSLFASALKIEVSNQPDGH